MTAQSNGKIGLPLSFLIRNPAASSMPPTVNHNSIRCRLVTRHFMPGYRPRPAIRDAAFRTAASAISSLLSLIVPYHPIPPGNVRDSPGAHNQTAPFRPWCETA